MSSKYSQFHAVDCVLLKLFIKCYTVYFKFMKVTLNEEKVSCYTLRSKGTQIGIDITPKKCLYVCAIAE